MAKYPNHILKRTIFDGRIFTFRSVLEARWSYYLDLLLRGGEIKAWDYECQIFEFEPIRHGVTRYKPDFKVTEKDDSVTWHETKGHLDGPSITKLRRMNKYHPDEKIWLIFDGISMTRSKSAIKKHIAINKVRNKVERVVDAAPIFKRLGLRHLIK